MTCDHPRRDPSPDQRHHGSALRGAFYARTNRTGPDVDRDLADQYRLCQLLAARFGELVAHFYDIGTDSRSDPAAGGPLSWRGGSAQLTAELASSDAGIDLLLVAGYDRLPCQPRRRPLLDAAERRRCLTLTAAELSTLDRDAGRGSGAARAAPLVVARVLGGVGDGR